MSNGNNKKQHAADVQSEQQNKQNKFWYSNCISLKADKFIEISSITRETNEARNQMKSNELKWNVDDVHVEDGMMKLLKIGLQYINCNLKIKKKQQQQGNKNKNCIITAGPPVHQIKNKKLKMNGKS